MRLPIVQRNGRTGVPTDEPTDKQQVFQSTPSWTPVVESIASGSTVHQRLLLIYGRAGPQDRSGWLAGLRIDHQRTESTFPSQHWDVTDSHFKALVHLETGRNIITLTFLPGQVAQTTSDVLSSILEVTYEPSLGNPPLHLVLLCAKDSPGTIDAPPSLIEGGEGTHHTLGAVVRKIRLWAYLSQAFTAEQMYRHGLGRRTFRLDEAWQPDTLSMAENSPWAMAAADTVSRQTARVHIVKTDKTVKELRDPDLAQQNASSSKNGDLYAIITEALQNARDPLRSSFSGIEEQSRLLFATKGSHVAVLVVDSHWSVKKKLIVAHAALGGANDIRFGMFGSHSTWAWPRGLEEVTSAFLNETPADPRYVANDAGQSGKGFEACNIGQGAFLHEVGHAFGCPHQSNGVMRRGYTTWNRCFMTREPGSSWRKEPSKRLITPADEEECLWHRLDALRFRYHELFRLPTDPVLGPGARQHKAVVLPTTEGIEIQDPTGIAFVEIHVNSDDDCRTHLEWDPRQCPRSLVLSVAELASRAQVRPTDRLCLKIFGVNTQCQQIENVQRFLHESLISRGGQTLIRGLTVGPNTGRQWQVEFIDGHGEQALTKLTVRHGAFLDGLAFGLSGNSRQIVVGGQGGGEEDVPLPAKAELSAIRVRSGALLDGLAFDFVDGHSSRWFGGQGGGASRLDRPEGYEIVGLHGTQEDLIVSLGLLLRKRERTQRMSMK